MLTDALKAIAAVLLIGLIALGMTTSAIMVGMATNHITPEVVTRELSQVNGWVGWVFGAWGSLVGGGVLRAVVPHAARAVIGRLADAITRHIDES